MNQKTESPTTVSAGERKSEFSPAFVRWMVTLTLLTLVFVLLTEVLGVWRHPLSFTFTPLPWITAGGIVISQGLDQFSGTESELPSLAVRLGMLGGFLLASVLGPVLFFLSWRKLLRAPADRRVGTANLGFIIGGAIFLFYVLSVVIGTPLQYNAASSLRSAQALGENRDKIIEGMTFVSFDACEYRILPKSLGGGGGSYAGYSIPERLVKNTGGVYQIVALTDSTITLAGASTEYEGALAQGVFGRDGTLKGPFDFHGEFR